MKYLLLLTCLLLNYVQSASSQVLIGIDGLTCSMCSNSIYQLLIKTPGVNKVKMDLNENIAEVYFKNDAIPDFKELSQQVIDAGYSVRFIKMKIDFTQIESRLGNVYKYGGNRYIYIGKERNDISNATNVTLIGKGFLSKKALKEWQTAIQANKNQITYNSYFFIF